MGFTIVPDPSGEFIPTILEFLRKQKMPAVFVDDAEMGSPLLVFAAFAHYLCEQFEELSRGRHRDSGFAEALALLELIAKESDSRIVALIEGEIFEALVEYDELVRNTLPTKSRRAYEAWRCEYGHLFGLE